ncbi:MAG: hypothetical protein NTW47_03355 [Proteobacteria bacterium]|nr:hypothetical protein [Pseudomonadota bacterium]
MNYTELQTTIASYAQRNDIGTIIPTFIELAEARFNRHLRVAEMEKTATTSAVSEFTQLPSDFQSIRYVTGVQGRPLQYQMPERLAQQAAEGWVPNPGMYTVQDLQLRVLPAPSATAPMTLQIVYYASLPPLATNTTNWLSEEYPDVYVSGAMVEACTWLKDYEGMVQWEERLQTRLEGMRAQSQQILFGGAIAVKAG